MSLYTSSQPASNNGSPSKRSDVEKTSRVLLVCVYDTIIFEITNDLIYQRFHEFGNVIRILIFDRREVTKLFIEYDNHQQALKARDTLDGKKLCNNICKMSIYFSTFDNVDLKHNTSQGIQFYARTKQTNNIYNVYSKQRFQNYSTNSQQDKSPTKQIQLQIDQFDQFSAFGINSIHRLNNLYINHNNHNNNHHNNSCSMLPRSKTANNQIQWHINQVNKRKNIWGETFDIDQAIKSDIDSILNCQSNQNQHQFQFQLQRKLQKQREKWSTNSQTNETPTQSHSPKLKSNIEKDINNKITEDKQKQKQKYNVISFKIKNILKHTHIYNLFSNFGNISSIIIKKTQIKIKFRTAQFAAIAKSYLNNTQLYQNNLQLTIQSSNNFWPQQGQFAEIICYDNFTDRFTQKKSITINPPSKTLHVSGMKKQKCTVQQINNMFKHILEPIRIKILKQNTDKNMALIQFDSIAQSFEIIANCHNMIVGGRKIQISFTKSQI